MLERVDNDTNHTTKSMSKRPSPYKNKRADEEEEADEEDGYTDEEEDAEVPNVQDDSYIVQHLKEYGITLIPDSRELVYRPVYTCIDTAADVVNGVDLFAASGTNNRSSVMIAVIILEEYSLQGTLYPVTVQLKTSVPDALPGTTSTRANSTWSAVLIPGTQHVVKDKVMFEPPARDMKMAREHFPDYKYERVMKDVIQMTHNGESEARLCIDTTDGKPSGAICALGYSLHHSGKIYPTITTKENGVERTYLRLRADEAETAARQFCMDARDARPTMPLNSIRVCASILEASSRSAASSSSFVLSMKLGIWCYYV